MKVLFLTVGGSHQPLKTAIEAVRPDQVVFFCTDRDPATGRPGSRSQIEGQGLCIRAHPADEKPTLPNVPTQCGLDPESWRVVVVKADDLDEACSEMMRAIAEYESHVRVADYTGGTKTMTAALVVASLETPGVELRLVGGMRASLQKVDDGTQYSLPAPVAQTRARRALKDNLAHWVSADYAAAARGLGAMPAPVDVDQRDIWLQARQMSSAFAAWDRFDHDAAFETLQPIRSIFAQTFPQHWNALRELVAEQDGPRKAPFRLWDLQHNACRRAHQQRFDDAVARVYRLLEGTAQWILKSRCGWDTGDLPKDVAERHGISPGPQGIYQTGLRGAWQIVSRELSGPATDFYTLHDEHLLELLRLRNHSILAHGDSAIGKAQWQRYAEFLDSSFRPLLVELLSETGIREPFGPLPTTWTETKT